MFVCFRGSSSIEHAQISIEEPAFSGPTQFDWFNLDVNLEKSSIFQQKALVLQNPVEACVILLPSSLENQEITPTTVELLSSLPIG